MLWLIGGLFYSGVDEPADEAKAVSKGIRGRLNMVRDDARFRKFIIALGLIAAPLQAISPLLPLAGYVVLCFLGGCAALRLAPASSND